MQRDYRHEEFFSPGTRPLSPFMWLFALIAIGSFAALIYYLDRFEKTKDEDTTAAQTFSLGKETPPVSVDTPPEEPNDEAESRFDFYKLLPKLQINVPESQVEPRNTQREPQQQPNVAEQPTQSFENPESIKPQSPPVQAEKPPQTALITNNPPIKPAFQYLLQAGSFKNFNEADKLKAGLALMGIEAHIERVVLNKSDVWHRVRIGPIVNEREMVRIRSLLRSQNIEPVMLKVKT